MSRGPALRGGFGAQVWRAESTSLAIDFSKRSPPPVTTAPRVRTLRNPHNLQDQLKPFAAKLASTISASLTSLFKPQEPEFCPPDVLPLDVEDMYDTMYTPPPRPSIPLYEETKEWLEEKIVESCVSKPDPFYQFDGSPEELPDEEGTATVFLRAQRLRLIARLLKQQRPGL